MIHYKCNVGAKGIWSPADVKPQKRESIAMKDKMRDKLNVIQEGSQMMTRQKGRLKKLKGRMQSSLSGFFRACIVGALVLLQFAIILVIPFFFREYATQFYILIEISGMIGILALTNDSRNYSYKFSWLCMILIFPISGLIMFNLWGKVGKKNKLNKMIADQFKKTDQWLVQDKAVSEEFSAKHPVSSRMSKYMTAKGAPLFKNNEARYYAFGEEAFEDLFEDMEHAKSFIFLEFFIVAEGAVWDQIHEILLRKIKEGVEVKFLYDDFGALFRTGKNFASDLRAEGFEVEIFNPIHKYASKLYMNFRDHQKIVVIDGNIGYTGGFNIADEYANLIERFGVWKDAGIRMTGDAVWGLTVTFLELWSVCAYGKEIDIEKYRPTVTVPENEMYCHVLRDGPALGTKSFVGTVYKQMINYAGKKMYIMTPYLILEETLIQSLVEAKSRGVDVRIITPSIPDKKHVKWLTEYNYGELLRYGIRIYEYTPGFIHSKVVMGEHCAIVGTINMDYRSFYLHYENGVWVYEEAFLKHIQKDFEDTFAVSREIRYEEWKNRPWKRKAVQHVLKVFSTLV